MAYLSTSTLAGTSSVELAMTASEKSLLTSLFPDFSIRPIISSNAPRVPEEASREITVMSLVESNLPAAVVEPVEPVLESPLPPQPARTDTARITIVARESNFFICYTSLYFLQDPS